MNGPILKRTLIIRESLKYSPLHPYSPPANVYFSAPPRTKLLRRTVSTSSPSISSSIYSVCSYHPLETNPIKAPVMTSMSPNLMVQWSSFQQKLIIIFLLMNFFSCFQDMTLSQLSSLAASSSSRPLSPLMGFGPRLFSLSTSLLLSLIPSLSHIKSCTYLTCKSSLNCTHSLGDLLQPNGITLVSDRAETQIQAV